MIGKTLSRTGWVTGSRIATTLPGIFLTPFIIGHLGLPRFGLFALVSGLFAYLTLLDFGTAASSMRFLTHERNGSGDALGAIYGTLNTVTHAIGLAALGFAVLAVPRLLPLLNVPASLLPEAGAVLPWIALTFWINLLCQQMKAWLNAAGHFAVPEIAALSGVSGYVLTTVLFLPIRPDLTMLVRAHLINGTTQAVLLLACGWFLGDAPSALLQLRWDRDQLRNVFTFSRNVWFSNASTIAVFEVQKAFLSVLVGIEAVGIYHLCRRLASLQRVIGTGFSAPLTQHATALHAKRDVRAFQEYFVRSLTLFSWLQVVVYVFLAVNAHRLLALWLGDLAPAESATTLIILASGMLATLLGNVPTCFTRARGITAMEASASLFAIACSLLLNAVFVPTLDLYGAALANSLTLMLAVYVFIRLSARAAPDLPPTLSLRAVIETGVAALLLFVSVFACQALRPTGSGRLQIFLNMGLVNGVPLLICGTLTALVLSQANRRAGLRCSTEIRQ